VAGVILNRVGSDNHESLLRQSVEATGVSVLGALRRSADYTWRDRHLGLVPVVEEPDRIRRSVGALAAAVDVSDARALAAQPVALARVAVRTWLRGTGDGHPPDAATVARVLAVARGEATATDVGHGLRVARSGGRLRLEHGSPTIG